MAIPQSATILHHLRQTMLRQSCVGLSDGQLLRAFLFRDDEAAFEALVRRHGPMVRGVCRRILRSSHDADDAFQAAFLVLIRKASMLASREVLGDWLHGVAYRTALKARTTAARRRMKEQQTMRRAAIVDEPERSEWLALLDQEIARLPAKYRLPVVLCDLEGRARKEAAQQLGWPEGTLSGRLSRARSMLARRLIRRGVTLSVGTLAAGLTSEASARVPYSQVATTCKIAMEFSSPSAAGAVPSHIAALTEGVVKAMFLTKMNKVAAIVATVLVLAASAGRYALVAAQREEQREEQSKPTKQDLPRVAGTKDEERILPIPSGNRAFQTDLLLAEVKNRQRKMLACPRILTLDGKEATVNIGPGYVYSINRSQVESFLGTNARVKICTGLNGKLGLVITVNQPIATTLGQEATVESRTIHALRWMELGKPITVTLGTGDKDRSLLEATIVVHEADKEVNMVVHKADQEAKKDSAVDMFWDFDTIRQSMYGYSKPPAPSEQEKKEFEAKRNASAEKDFKLAEFYRRTGIPGAARFYYELIRQRYLETDYAKRATQRLAEVKPPARVGQIFISGNNKVSVEAILKEVSLFPGQVLTFPDLQIAEKKLARVKGLKRAEVGVIDREGEASYKDIQITVEEK